VTNRGFQVTNTACADYFGRFTVTYAPDDAGTAETGTTEAATAEAGE
jgi:hypothetical protein